ncbi:pentapeptide repeat-containing protein [Streptomyces violascens]|uniref:pentapeptide repeat-containing protein n=1 Tax=Streptomyces violascens TaxID=67381 RepID=UPI0036591254
MTIVVAFGLVLTVMWRAPWFLDRVELGRLHDPGPKATVVSGFRTGLAALAVASAGAIGLIFQQRNLKITQQTLEHNRQKDRRQLELTLEAQLTDYYIKAVSLLAHTDRTERLGGIYALERIMRDSAKDHDTVVQLLAAYIREYAKRDRSRAQVIGSKPNPPSDDIRAALTVLGRRPERAAESEIDLSNTDLPCVNLHHARLPRTLFVGCNLDGAELTGANLAGSSFYRASLRHIQANNVNLRGTQLSEADMRDADALGADLRDALMHKADLRGAHLTAGNLHGASLHEAQLVDTSTGGKITIVDVEQLLTASVTDDTKLSNAHRQAEGMEAHINKCTRAHIMGESGPN